MAIFHQYPYTNFHDLNLDWIIQLCKRIEELINSTDFDGIRDDLERLQEELLVHSAQIEELREKDSELYEAITRLETVTDQLWTHDMTHDNKIAALEEAVTGVENALGQLENRVTNLESAAFEGITVAPIPRTFAMDLRNGWNRNINIYYADGSEATGADTDSIKWGDGGRYTATGSSSEPNTPLNTQFKLPAFQRSGTVCYLEIPFIFPYLYSSYRVVNPTLYFYIQRYIGTTDTTAPTELMTVTLRDLIAGVKRSTAQNDYWNDIQFVLNQTTGWYDLRLYNGRDGLYSTGSDHRETSFIISESMIFPSGSSETNKRLAYYAAYSSAERQVEGIIGTRIADLRSQIIERESNDLTMLARYDILRTDAQFTPLNATLENNDTVYTENNINWLTDTEVDYKVTKIAVQFSLTGVQTTAGTQVTLGQFILGTPIFNLGKSHMLSIDIRGQSGATAYGNITENGTVTMVANQSGTFSVRVHGYIYDLVVS